MYPLNSSSFRYRAYRHSQGRVHIASVGAHELEPSEKQRCFVLLRPRYVGVCSADIREVRDERHGRSDFGHEVVGTVIESTHPEFRSGDSVILNPFEKIERDTAYSEMMFLIGSEQALQGAIVRVPGVSLPYAIAEPLACVIHATRQSRVGESGQRLVCGAGFFGFLLYCYLDHLHLPVTLTNRSPERLTSLLERFPELRTSSDSRAGEFASVFLMQSRIDRQSIDAVAPIVREHGEIVLFGAIDAGTDPWLYALRKQQLRAPYPQTHERLYLQGTLDATAADIQEAVDLLGRADFVQRVLPIFAPPLTFEEGADHLTRRARAPQSFHKYVVDMGAGTNEFSQP